MIHGADIRRITAEGETNGFTEKLAELYDLVNTDIGMRLLKIAVRLNMRYKSKTYARLRQKAESNMKRAAAATRAAFARLAHAERLRSRARAAAARHAHAERLRSRA